MYGFVECDIHVPSHMEEYFSDMAPVFKNTLVGREHLGPDMLAFAEANECLERPQRMLVSSLFGKQILLYNELLRWYLMHGLVVTNMESHRRVMYKDTAAGSSSAIASNKICSLEELNCDVFEIQQFPSEVGCF